METESTKDGGLIINVTGISSITRQPERAVVSVDVSFTGEDQLKVNNTVTNATSKIQHGLRRLAPKLDGSNNSRAHPDAAITHWTMQQIQSYSYARTIAEPRPLESSSSITSAPNFGISVTNPMSPDASTNPNRHTITMYTAKCSFSIRFRDFDKLANTLSQMMQLEGVQVRSVEWVLTDATRTAVASEMRKNAVRDAVEQANDFAVAAGRNKSVSVLQIDSHAGGAGYGQGFIMKTVCFAADFDTANPDESLKFEPEEIKISLDVQVKFEAR